MSKREFKNAPVSEVVIGVTFKKKVINLEQVFDFSALFRDKYPVLELKNTLANQKLVEFKHITEIDDDKAGPFRLFQRSVEGDYLLQYQSNKLLFNWIRKDNVDVGGYPGFSSIKSKFEEILEGFLDFIGSEEEVDYFELTYQDRILWQDYISNLSDIKDIFNVQPPLVSTELINNISSQYTYKIPDLNGYALLELRSASTIEEKQILKFQYTVRGSAELSERDNWFHNSHGQQIKIFREIFNSEILEKWK